MHTYSISYNTIMTSNQKSIQKIMCIHRLALPTDMIETIMSFLFYDKYQHKWRKTKNRAMYFIVTAISTRNWYQGEEDNTIFTDDIEHWIFGFDSSEFGVKGKLQLQGINCLRCGNYKLPLPVMNRNRQWCYCHDNIWSSIIPM